MFLNNKKLAKVSFFLFLFFSFFALGFTITNVSAYTSEDMPSGYRPVSFDDEGKVFGVDLVPVIYFDTSSVPSSIGSLYLTDSNYRFYVDSSTLTLEMGSDSTTIYNGSEWLSTSYTATDGWHIHFSFVGHVDVFSSFFYVKDIVPEVPLIDSILSLFNKLVIWIPSVITGLIALFYSSESGLTFLGALAVAGLGISVIFLLIGIIQNFLHFRG